jgi:Ca-activated chloride channel family protein
VAELPEGTRVGLVSFGAYAQLNIALTDNHEAFLETLNGMPLIRGTAIGEGLLTSLKALELAGGRPQSREDGSSLGSIVLLSDGNSRSGIAPLEALEDIKAQGVTVYTVGIGSTAGSLGQASFDESTLQAIAAETGGRYSFVASADDLRDVYRNLSQTIAWRWQADEATALLALCAALVLGVSLMMAQGSRRLF